MGILRAAGRTAVVAGTATAVSGRVAHKQNEKYAAQEAANAPAPAAAAPAAPEEDQTTQLKKLADLHAQGVLTDDEFSAAKAKVLGI